MKKTLVSALTAALVVGAASTTFAAANPFSDVPADHWAYDAVSQLAADGVIEGYGDTTFQGDKNITRYEMAQMIAKAMAKNTATGNDKALLDKLAAEFSDELNNLGVRVSNLERNADMVKWNGEMRNRAWSTRKEGEHMSNEYQTKFRLSPSAEINKNWQVKAKIDANIKPNEDNTAEAKLLDVYAQANYPGYTLKLGRMPLFSDPDEGLTFDDHFSGAALTFGNKLQATLLGGRFAAVNDTDEDHKAPKALDTADVVGIDLAYKTGKLGAAAGYKHLQSDNFKSMYTDKDGSTGYLFNGYSKDNNEDKADIYSGSLRYTFDHNSALEGAYAQNEKADKYDNSFAYEYDYKNADRANAGTWGAFVGYRYVGANVSLAPTYDGVDNNTKGVQFGAAYVPFKNVIAKASYFFGEDLATAKDHNKLFGQVSLYF